ncbi:hypothetical protein DHB64_15915 [Antarcticibacterium sp. W02-3]|nr:hypothetical protein [Antarcticibacterium sp. W02-3]
MVFIKSGRPLLYHSRVTFFKSRSRKFYFHAPALKVGIKMRSFLVTMLFPPPFRMAEKELYPHRSFTTRCS